MKKVILVCILVTVFLLIYSFQKKEAERPYLMLGGNKVYLQGPLLEDGSFFSKKGEVFIDGQGYSVAPEFQDEFIRNHNGR